MTALRQQVHEMVDMMPESVLLNLIQLMQTEQTQQIEVKKAKMPGTLSESEFKRLKSKLGDKLELKENADEIQKSIDFIKSLHPLMDESLKNKTLDEWREERLREKYAEYFD